MVGHGEPNPFVHLMEEGLLESELSQALEHRAANQSAQNITAPGVAGQNAIGDAEAGSADVIADNANGTILDLVLAILDVADLLDLLDDLAEDIRIVNRPETAENGASALETHARINALEGEVRHRLFDIPLVRAIRILEATLPLGLNENVMDISLAFDKTLFLSTSAHLLRSQNSGITWDSIATNAGSIFAHSKDKIFSKNNLDSFNSSIS